ncbi:undecaprenyl diphosphate synthase [Oceanospirillum multiglobuliferum]|uniref:Ditrans,polycis-undecaprenyl-diphosphate synthase ((2E,6E)-farnesyl-diphosphate specific) n=1 Tax=Oceanospirillum multiglobuliferum TaxID=64969 RepID=A0A1T4RTU5_9GAMM|nr:isoprenyl transferase [Oceanospirillum multiglobuliferum]OPX54643.1 di-trans,poly-cis-decaprenylcistransferase [Oceanospirillum multiglobuliferum]SKA19317.1 undecaprenyl diphosphate synthase [Oceanospirillum multiglobuliferum]
MHSDKKITNVPRHIAIIMDGNNRWAKKRFLPGIAGHKAGANAVRAVIRACVQHQVEALTLFAFSSENWQRPITEVNALMELFLFSLRREIKQLHKHNIRLRIIGDKTAFSADIQQGIADAEALTANNRGLQLNIAANYGGRWDIVNAAKTLAQQVASGLLQPEQIDETCFNQVVSLSDLPAPDLCIRTAGEQRISNFLLWQFAYTEFYYSSLLWPDFREDALTEAIIDYSGRQRRFGKTSEQVEGQTDGQIEGLSDA